jgi:PKD repeat protein
LFCCNNEASDTIDLRSKEKALPDFEFSVEGDCNTSVQEVVFENKTIDADSYLWDFGDGTTSNEINPKKIYAKSGSYTVTFSHSSTTRA